LSGLLFSNLDVIGHSQVCHLIQDCALEHQLFELTINLPNLQPIAVTIAKSHNYSGFSYGNRSHHGPAQEDLDDSRLIMKFA
jgi:hypothetical protein